MRVLTTFFVGAAGFAALYVGLFVALPHVMAVAGEHGQGWGAVVGAAAVGVCALLAFGLFRFHDRRSATYAGGRAPRDQLYCQRCGAPVTLGDQVCGRCGGNRFGIGRPAHAAETPARPGA
jgi:hypothetical protein